MKTNRLMSSRYIYRIDSVRCHNIVLIIKLLLQWHHPFKRVSATCISPPPRLFHHRVLWNTMFSFFLWSLSPFLAFISHFFLPSNPGILLSSINMSKSHNDVQTHSSQWCYRNIELYKMSPVTCITGPLLKQATWTNIISN